MCGGGGTTRAPRAGARVPRLLLACWLPGALLGNALGTGWATRVPQGPFRLMTLGLVMVTGLATVVTVLAGR